MEAKPLNRILLGAVLGMLLGGGVGAAADTVWGITGPRAGECYDQDWRGSVDRRLTNLSNDVAVLLDRSSRAEEARNGPGSGNGAGP